jgi:hypothetical protein
MRCFVLQSPLQTIGSDLAQSALCGQGIDLVGDGLCGAVMGGFVVRSLWHSRFRSTQLPHAVHLLPMLNTQSLIFDGSEKFRLSRTSPHKAVHQDMKKLKFCFAVAVC